MTVMTINADSSMSETMSDMSLPSSPEHQGMSSPEDNSDDILDMNWSGVSEGDGRSYRESFSDDEEKSVGGDISNQTEIFKDPFVYPGSLLKLSESVLLILTLVVARNLNGNCLLGVIASINLHCIPGLLNN